MLDNTDEENTYNYSPNELAHLAVNDPQKYRRIVESNLEPGDSVERWEQRNLEQAQKHLKKQ